MNRWQLTEETLRCLLAALGTDEERATERYERLRGRLTFFFMRHRSVLPEDLADEVVNRLARMLADGRPIANIEAFSLGIARIVALEEQAKCAREKSLLPDMQRNRSQVHHTSGEEEIAFEAMETEWNALPAKTREMLALYHAGSGSERIHTRQRLATELGISNGTLRKRVFDLRMLLRGKLRNTMQPTDKARVPKEKGYFQ